MGSGMRDTNQGKKEEEWSIAYRIGKGKKTAGFFDLHDLSRNFG